MKRLLLILGLVGWRERRRVPAFVRRQAVDPRPSTRTGQSFREQPGRRLRHLRRESDGTGLTQLTNDAWMRAAAAVAGRSAHPLLRRSRGARGDERRRKRSADPSQLLVLPRCVVPTLGTSSAPTTRRALILDTVDGTMTQLTDSGVEAELVSRRNDDRVQRRVQALRRPGCGGARRRLGIRKAAEFAAPAWSPDSQRVAYVSVRVTIATHSGRSARTDRRASPRAERRRGHAPMVAGWFEDRIRQVPAALRQRGFRRSRRRDGRARGQLEPRRRLRRESDPGRPTGPCSTAAAGFVTPRTRTSSPSRRAAALDER